MCCSHTETERFPFSPFLFCALFFLILSPWPFLLCGVWYFFFLLVILISLKGIIKTVLSLSFFLHPTLCSSLFIFCSILDLVLVKQLFHLTEHPSFKFAPGRVVPLICSFEKKSFTKKLNFYIERLF